MVYARRTSHTEDHNTEKGSLLKEIILGGQDGLVNVLGIILGVATATSDTRIVLISGLAAAFAESISMGAVAYSSTRAEKQFYQAQKQKELYEIEKMPKVEEKEIYDIYYEKGFRGKQLNSIVKKIISDKDLWLKEMMEQELRLYSTEHRSSIKSAWIVFYASFLGSIIPLIPFFLMSISSAVVVSILVSVIILFGAGVWKAKLTIGSPWKNGIEMAILGIVAALLGYVIGKVLENLPL